MVTTPEGFNDYSPISPITSTQDKKSCVQKSFCLFTYILDVKKNAIRRVGAAKSKRKTIKYGDTLLALKKNEEVIQKLIKR